MYKKDIKDIFSDIKLQRKNIFKDLYDNYFRMIYGIAFSVCKNEAMSYDVVQNVMLKLFTISDDRFPTSNELTWLYTLTKNEALQILRKEKVVLDIDEFGDMPSLNTEIDDFIDMDNFYSIISCLNDKQKKIVTLKILGDMTHKEISQLLNMKIGTVQWIYNTAIVKLRTKFTICGAFSLMLGLLSVRKLYMDYHPISSGDVGIQSVPTVSILAIVLSIGFVLSLFPLGYYLKKFLKK